MIKFKLYKKKLSLNCMKKKSVLNCIKNSIFELYQKIDLNSVKEVGFKLREKNHIRII